MVLITGNLCLGVVLELIKDLNYGYCAWVIVLAQRTGGPVTGGSNSN